LQVKVMRQITDCVMRCQTRITLQCMMVDAAGRAVWRFDSEIAQADDSTEIDAAAFDAFAVKMLTAMKKDGAISS
jgi:hypothetical protein